MTSRKIKITPHINPYALGSVMVEFGNTKVHITVAHEEKVPNFLYGQKKGWVTAEYAMLPHSTHQRIKRDRKGIGGRAQEIQRLIGRSLRGIVDQEALGERTLMIDCDVIVADGGTRTASITGAYVALALAIKKLQKEGKLTANPLKYQVAALSVGIDSAGKCLVDLNYEEDSTCHTDMNIVMTSAGEFIEIQGTAEGAPFNSNQLENMLKSAREALGPIFEHQKEVIDHA